MTENEYKIELRDDGVILVRIPSKERDGERLPDAVFSFRSGDPQYSLWEERFQEQKQQSAQS